MTAPIAPRLRQLMRQVAQPVAVVTCSLPPSSLPNHGATLSSLSSISLSPPLVAFSLRLPSTLASYLQPPKGGGCGFASCSMSAIVPLPPVQELPRFTVHLLSGEQEAVARAFARQAPIATDTNPPPEEATTPAQDGPTNDAFSMELFEQLDAGSLGAFECTILKALPLKDFAGTKKDGEAEESELFIARVEAVRLPEEGALRKGSLVYCGHEYGVVEAGKP